jgi:hypothetical protein
VALRLADDRLLVGPDNGLLSLAAAGEHGVVEAADIGGSPFRLMPVSATFHGRDVFAPVAARLAAGASLAEAGTPLEAAELVTVTLPRPRREGEALLAHVLYVDRFGNAELDLRAEDLSASGTELGHDLELGTASGSAPARFARTFADVAHVELIVYEDAYRTLAIAVSGGDAAARLGLAAGDELRIAPA